ncbi:MAG: exodeoxyribonuclease VII large subunit [Candidatus Acetothermia bacterium]
MVNRAFDFSSSQDLPEKEAVYSVSQLNREARNLLEANFSAVWVEGELSNLSRSSSSHLYFTVKDEDSELDAVMFAGDNCRLEFEPEDGQAVLARGNLTIYERRGRYQLKVTRMKQAGKGRLQIKFEELKQALREEGLFDEEHKQSLPEFPSRIGLVTSAEGAAVQDMVSVIKDRFPPARLFLFPVRVQGEEAASEIAQAIDAANRFADEEGLDLLLVGRGGGSLEDLWPFNEELVARAIFRSELPVISAVGHEVDFSISDFVADLRVPTPTAAGKEAVPDGRALVDRVEEIAKRMLRIQVRRIDLAQDRLERACRSYAFKRPFRMLEDYFQQLDQSTEDLLRTVRTSFVEANRRYQDLVNRLELVNPASILERGYSITLFDGEPVTDAESLSSGQSIRSRLHRGAIVSLVEEVISDE